MKVQEQKKADRRRFAVEAAVRIGVRMHELMQPRGSPPSINWDAYYMLWRAEAKEAKRRGLYSASTYDWDAAGYLISMARDGGWRPPC